ncbi:MAG: AAA family ATPase [Chloroflexota bacterium]
MQLSILLLAADRLAADALSVALARPGHGVTVVALPEELVLQAAGYSLIVLDEVPPVTVAAIITELRGAEATATVPVLAVAGSDSLDQRIALLEAGADDIITKPFDQVELEARIEALSLRFQRSRGGTARQAASIGDAQSRRVITVFSPKGGVGTTTVATNLALLAAERHPNAVLLIDFDLAFGQVASHLNLQPKQSLLELIRDDAALHEPELFRTYAVHHASGVHLLAAPPTPGFAASVTGEHVDLIIARALEAYQLVVVDAGTALDDRMLALFSRSDIVIVPVLPEIPALNAVHLLLDQLSETGAMGAATMFVLNNAFARQLLRRADIENALGAQITADLPYDPFVYLKAANEGVPVVRNAPKSPPAEHLRKLASIVFGGAGTAVAAGPPKERKGLFGRRR